MYLDFYGLKENPFNVTSDPSFLYLSHTHQEALDHLIFGIEQRKGFIEITGEIGAGKTTLCRALLDRLSPATQTSMIFNPGLPEKQLLEAIVEDFGIDPKKRSKVSLLKELNSYLLAQLANGNNAVLIIDEAQNLRNTTLEAIRMLSNLETEKEKLLQIVLVGQPELHDKLSSDKLIQLRQRISVRFHVRALDADEIKRYIAHRINVAGGVNSISFSDETLSEIFNYSRGIPRLINLLCDKALLAGFISETHFLDKTIIDKCIEDIEGIHSLAVA